MKIQNSYARRAPEVGGNYNSDEYNNQQIVIVPRYGIERTIQEEVIDLVTEVINFKDEVLGELQTTGNQGLIDAITDLRDNVIANLDANTSEATLIEIRDELLLFRQDVITLLTPPVITKQKQLITIEVTPNQVYSTGSAGNGGSRAFPLTQCEAFSILLRGTSGFLRMASNNIIEEPYQLVPAGFMGNYSAPHYSEYYFSYTPEDPTDTATKIVELEFIFII